MAAELFYLPGRSAIDLNGLVVAGAEVTFYATGTLTKQAVYSDADLTTELANPCVANAAGRFSNIYLDDSLVYRVVGVDPSDGTTLFDVDPYYPGDAAEATSELLSASITAVAAAAAAASLVAFARYDSFDDGIAATSAGDVFYVVSQAGLYFYKNGTSADANDPYYTMGSASSGAAYTEVYLADLLTPTQLDRIQADTEPYVDVGALLENLVNEVGTLSPLAPYQSAPKVILPAGTMRFEQAVNLKRTVWIEGAGRGDNSNSAPTKIWVAPDTTGFVINDKNTLNAGLDPAGTTYSAILSRLSGFLLKSEGGTDRTAVGIRVRTKCTLDFLNIADFPGNNIHAYCTAASGVADRVGNCSYSLFSNIRSTNSGGWGLFIDGSDANIMFIDGLDLRNNTIGGVFDGCLLGNSYSGLHTAFNGNNERTSCWYNGAKFLWIGTAAGSEGLVSGAVTPGTAGITPGSDLTVWQWDGPSTASDAADGYTTTFAMYGPYVVGSKVLYQGHRFTALTTAAPATVPFSTSTNWLFVGAQTVANSFFPAYNASTQYLQGASMWLDEANAYNTVKHLYEEGSQQSYIASKSSILGGAYGGTYGAVRGSGVAWVGRGYNTASEWTHPNGLGTLTFFGAADTWLKFKYVQGSAQGMELRMDTTNHDYRLVFGGSVEAARLTSSNTTQTAGRASAIGQGWLMALKLMIGSSAADARELTNGTVAPASGQAAKGDICFNRNIAAAGSAGWMCTTGGTNGSTSVWKTMANVAA